MGDSLEAMERDPELDRAGEGGGGLEVQRPCRGQRSERRGLGSGILHMESRSQTSA